MAVSQNASKDLQTFIEYQQVMSEKEIRKSNFSRDQVYQIYADKMTGLHGKELIKEHKAFIEQPKLYTTEKRWLENNLDKLYKHTAASKIGNTLPGHDSLYIEAIEDHAAGMTDPNKLHPAMRNPEKLQHALGVITYVSGMRKEQNIDLTNKLAKTAKQLGNLVSNLITRNIVSKKLVEQLITEEPKKEQDKSMNKPIQRKQSQDQNLSR